MLTFVVRRIGNDECAIIVIVVPAGARFPKLNGARVRLFVAPPCADLAAPPALRTHRP
jgi:hypothetical protein